MLLPELGSERHPFPTGVRRQRLGVDGVLQRGSDILRRYGAADDDGLVQRIEREEDDVRVGGLLDGAGERVVDLVGGDERAQRSGGGTIAQRRADRHEHRALDVVEPRPARLIAAQRVRDEGRDRQIAIVLLPIIGARDQDAVAIRDEHPGGIDQAANVVRLIRRLGARPLVEQPLPVLGNVGRHGAGTSQGAGAGGEIIVHGAARREQRAVNRRIGGVVRFHRRDAERNAQHRHHEQRRREKDLRGQAERGGGGAGSGGGGGGGGRSSSARARHSSGSRPHTCCGGTATCSRVRSG